MISSGSENSEYRKNCKCGEIENNGQIVMCLSCWEKRHGFYSAIHYCGSKKHNSDDGYIVMQYVGLNGKRIFEWDIIKFKNGVFV